MSYSFLSETGVLALSIILITLSTIRWFGLLIHHRGRMAYRFTPRRGFFYNIFQTDVAVILPVVNHRSENFIPTIRSILENTPGQLYVMVVGKEAYDEVMPQMEILRQEYRFSQIHVGAVHEANKRRQIAHALSTLDHGISRLTVFTEQGTYWPTKFLISAIRPFDDLELAAITVPRMAHVPALGGIWANIKAHLFSFHYSVQAEDNRAVNSLDGSALFGGPTTLVLTQHLKEDRFKNEFEKEKWFFERPGPLSGGEHFYLNRYLLEGNKKTLFLDSPKVTVSVEMNSVGEFIGEFLRTIRNNWRTCFSMAPHCAWLRIRWGHVIFPAAARMTWWPTIFFPVTLLIDIFSIILAFNYSNLNTTALTVWIVITTLVIGTQAISNLLVARRMHGNKSNVFVTLLCVLVSLPFQHTLEVLKVMAMLTYWKTDVECTQQDVNVPRGRSMPWNWGYWDDMGLVRTEIRL
ncbi:hypothetical protein FPOAC2_12634 [Fusarium poae]|uniref:hypothetical protein n=1 Tax=Fusarium poae TaxID=36050 RepID=UPI001CEA0EAD|nr:hypothetical protein FPOAC1_012301 [Fusarium poae]KAG8667470.1 hypothetical protein FPOAC1_012301 [Fusarium poae]